jgi:DNA-binding transcriptional MocR family regulator
LRRSSRETLGSRDAERCGFYGVRHAPPFSVTPLGFAPLRRVLVRRMALHGIEVGPDRIMATETGTRALDLAGRFLVEPAWHGSRR